MVRDSREEWKTREGVFDQFTIGILKRLSGAGHFGELARVISPGKEATVFAVTRGDGYAAVKIYRLETATFSKMFAYIRVDPRYARLRNNQRQVIFSWAEREYRNLLLCRTAGVRAPMPIAHRSNVLVMEFIGHGTQASPLLKHKEPEDPEAFAKLTLDEIEKLSAAGLAHGDLSEYNIINHEEEPVLIDFSHTAPMHAPNSHELLARDVENVCKYFQAFGVKLDIDEQIDRMLKVAPKKNL